MRKVTAAVLGGAMLALVGCASTGSSTSDYSQFDADADYAKMAQITEEAMARGYRVVWVHPPQKKKAEQAQQQ